MFFVDSHCHLTYKKFAHLSDGPSVADVIKRAAEHKVLYMLNVCTDTEDIEQLRKTSDTCDIIKESECDMLCNGCNIFHTVGVHPLEAKKHIDKYNLDELFSLIENELSNEKCIAIGEIGLDYYYSKDSIKEQTELFHLHMSVAQKHSMPVCIHSRNAEEDTLHILRQYPGVRGVLHCFTGTKELAFGGMDLGYYVSASGVVTFKKSTDIQNIIKTVPIDLLLIETDSPFLAPEPMRGKTNEPAFVIYVAEKLSDLLNTSIEVIAHETANNFFSLFNKAGVLMLLWTSQF